MSTSSANRPSPPKLRTPRQPSTLPDWMLDPPPPRRTVGDRTATAVLTLPGVAALRRGWWSWQGRRRLHQRYPNTVKVVASVLSFLVALALVLAANALFGMA
ncbi:hypothetical protein QTQ03_27185 [Micromonospora sp. WMMA1363]|uniref:hypothetical protein n=1 Tax=Micromonospora sp. WMMA1363 TaxID=3053985 RepID=UPI00259D03F7|nr:hypothetical protein [Micromonospora sp. WMMA1363]MDM4723107.1 hypothetical protein [Micromonospora sp. WMMA1363]